MKNQNFTFNLNSLASLIVLLVMITTMYSCEKEPIEVVEGMAPIYFSYDDFTQIKTTSPRTNTKLTKIVTQGNYIYITDLNLGIHVIDNTDPTAPVKAYFWNIPGNTEFTIKDNVLYANNGRHLLLIDITNPADIKLISVVKDQYPIDFDVEAYPLNYRGKFECYYPDKGGLVGWELKTLTNPLCETN